MRKTPTFAQFGEWKNMQIKKLQGWLSSGSITEDEYFKKVAQMNSYKDYCSIHSEQDEEVQS